MKSRIVCLVVVLVASGCQCGHNGDKACKQSGWVALFDGRTLDGWKASENMNSFKVKDGMIAANGARSHLFYVGPANGENNKIYRKDC